MDDHLLKGMAGGETLLVVGLVDTATVEEARKVHDTYPTVSAALGRVISGAVLLSSIMKEGQKVVLQVAGDGPLREVVAESDWSCRVRGYVKRPHLHLPLKNGKLDVGGAIGKGFLNVIKDLGLKEPYRGTVKLQSGEIAEDLAYYLNVSEQIPAAVSLGVYVDPDNSVTASGGFMVQALPNAEEETVDYVENRLKGLRPVSSMIREGMGPKEIMEEAIGAGVRILERKDVIYSCPCSKDRVLDAISALGRKDIEDFINKDKPVEVVCRFCRKGYVIPAEELLYILKTADQA